MRLRLQGLLKFVKPLALAVLVLVLAAPLLYFGQYYHAEEEAFDALRSDGGTAAGEDGGTAVREEAWGWFFDGPGEDTAYIFYPGAKVEEEAYAPLLHRLAAEGIDGFLVKMPAHFAFFGMGRARDVMEAYSYEHWYVGGHSLGGVAASYWAASLEEEPEAAAGSGGIDGVILLASYPASQLPKEMKEIAIFGSEDQVLDREAFGKAKALAPAEYLEFEIPGGNHAGFGCYGEQKGDGEATISGREQQEETCSLILRALGEGE